MKKTLVIAGLAALPMTSQALPLIDIDVGYHMWEPAYTGEIDVSVAGQAANIDFENDLGFDSEAGSVIFAKIDHAVPLLPNLKVQQVSMSQDATGVYTQEFSFAGQTIPANADLATTIDFSHTDATLYWGLPLPIVDIDFGITLRNFDGLMSMDSTISGTTSSVLNQDVALAVPMGYLHVGAAIPMTGVRLDAEYNSIGLVSDYDVSIQYTLPVIPVVDVNLRAGLKSFNVDFDTADFEDYGLDFDDSFALNTEISGVYFGLSAAF